METAVKASQLTVGDMVVDPDACGYSKVTRVQFGLNPQAPLFIYFEGEEGSEQARSLDPFEMVRIKTRAS